MIASIKNRRGKMVNGTSSKTELLYFRLILIAAAISYVLFGVLYKIYSPKDFPMSMAQRSGASIFFLSLLLATFLSDWAKEHAEILMYLAASLALSHLTYFSYINNYRLNYALSLLIVLIIVNFLFKGNLRLVWFNLAVDTGVATSVYIGTNPGFNKTIYVLSVLIVSLISYLLSKSRKRSQEEYEQLFENSPIGLISCSPDGQIKDLNKEMSKISGNPETKKLRKLNIFELFEVDKNNLRPVENRETQLTFPWGEKTWVDYSIELIPRGSESPRDIVVACKDITGRKIAEEKIEYISFHDDLTDLYNRSFFQANVEQFSSELYYPFSVIFIDIDKLKLINDAFGHQIGDDLLTTASEVIRNSCREEDLVFRWGGDEIVILLPKTAQIDLEKIANRIRKNCDGAEFEPIDLNISLGTATEEKYNEGPSLEHIIRKAEERMYENKMDKQEDISRKIINKITEELEEKSSEVIQHSLRVEKLASRLGEKLELPENISDTLRITARYHDIGKVYMDERLLKRDPDKLPRKDKESLKDHPEIGHQILKELHDFGKAALPVLHHHEQWNGKGYPRGKASDRIPYISRIVAVINSYDNLRRPIGIHAKGKSKREAIEIIKEGSGAQFDPDLVKEFVDMVSE